MVSQVPANPLIRRKSVKKYTKKFRKPQWDLRPSVPVRRLADELSCAFLCALALLCHYDTVCHPLYELFSLINWLYVL